MRLIIHVRRRVIGDLSDMEKVFEALELHELRLNGKGC